MPTPINDYTDAAYYHASHTQDGECAAVNRQGDPAMALVNDVAANAGDASGNADRAAYMFAYGADAAQVILTLEWAQEQARLTIRSATRAIEHLRALKTPNAELRGRPLADGPA